MQQLLAILSLDADQAAITSALGSGSIHSYLHQTVLIADGDDAVRTSLSQTKGVIATLSDDDATNLAATADITQLDTAGLATLIGTALGVHASFDESVVLAVGGWIFGFSPPYIRPGKAIARARARPGTCRVVCRTTASSTLSATASQVGLTTTRSNISTLNGAVCVTSGYRFFQRHFQPARRSLPPLMRNLPCTQALEDFFLSRFAFLSAMLRCGTCAQLSRVPRWKLFFLVETFLSCMSH